MLPALLLAAAIAMPDPAAVRRPPNAVYTYTATLNGAPIGSTSIAISGNDAETIATETAAFSVPVRFNATATTRYDATLRETSYTADFRVPAGPQHTDVTVNAGSVHVSVPGRSGDIAADASAPFELTDDHLEALHAMLPAILAAHGMQPFTLAVLAGGRAIVVTVLDTPPPAPPAGVPAGDASLSLDVAGLRINYWYDPATFVLHALTVPMQGFALRLTGTAAAGTTATPPPLTTALPTPLPHFTSRDVRFTSADGTVLAGTLTIPERGRAPFPAVVFVHGSGPADRDETIGPNAIFLQLSNALSNAGVAVLRYDKRGVAKSGVPGTSGTREQLLADIEAAFRFARAQPGIDPRRVALLGHSEGGELVPTVAAREPGVAGIILLAPPAIPLAQVSMKQVLAIATPGERASIRAEEFSALDAIRRGHDASDAWYRSSMDIDPTVDIARVRVPILIFQGAADAQIDVADLPRLVAAARAANHAVTVRVLGGDNHLFEPAATPHQTAREALTQYLSVPAYVDARVPAGIVSWFATLSRAISAPPRAVRGR